MIPRRIIQLYIRPQHSAKRLGPLLGKCQRSLRSLHADFEYLFFTEGDCRRFIEERNAGFLPLWDFYVRPVQKADFFRVFALHEIGGFYFDLDIFFHRALDAAVLRGPVVFPWEWTMSRSCFEHRHKRPPASDKELRQIGNYAFGGEAGHWFFREVLEEMIRRTEEFDVQNPSSDDVFYTTGPDLVNAVFRKHEKQLRGDMILLDGEAKPQAPCYTDPKLAGASFQFGKYGNHLMANAWR